MSTTRLQKRLAALEARRKLRTEKTAEMTATDRGRRAGWILTSAAKGKGCAGAGYPETAAMAKRLAGMLCGSGVGVQPD
jgi:hypothetical protein